MRAYGTDRVRVAGTKVLLHAHVPKGWNGRGARAPGTAVLWDEVWYEVLDVQTGTTGTTYVLAPWPEEEAIRVSSRYDEAGEGERARNVTAQQRREKQAAATTFLSIVIGHAPAAVQTHIGNELGIPPSRMTLLSTLPGFVGMVALILLAVAARVDQQSMPGSFWFWLLVVYFFVDAGVRAPIAFTQNRPVGSIAGWIGYALVFLVAPKRMRLLSPLQQEKGTGTMTLPPDEETALRDAVTVRGPLLSLLTPTEQQRLVKRFEFDWRRNGQLTAWVILAFAAMGGVSAATSLAYDGARLSAVLSLLAAGLLGIEQVVRLIALQRGPAGSVLGAVVRPFVRHLVERA